MERLKGFLIKSLIFIIPVMLIIIFIVAFIFALKDMKASADGKTFDTYVGSSFDEKVWWALKDSDLGLSDIAIAGAMGNFYQESCFRANNLEDQFESKLGYTDETYTEAVDSEKYTIEQFTSDHDQEGCGAGYGLCQWTWHTRKEGLYKFAKSKGVSIADENMQIEYMIAELHPNGGAGGNADYVLSDGQGYSPDDWKNATTIEQSARAFCGVFEKGSWSDTRSSKAQEYYDKFHNASRPSSGGNESEGTTSGNVKGTRWGIYTSACSGLSYKTFLQNPKDGAGWSSDNGCWATANAVIMSAFGWDGNPGTLPTWTDGGDSNYSIINLSMERVYNIKVSDIVSYLDKGQGIHIRVEGRKIIHIQLPRWIFIYSSFIEYIRL